MSILDTLKKWYKLRKLNNQIKAVVEERKAAASAAPAPAPAKPQPPATNIAPPFDAEAFIRKGVRYVLDHGEPAVLYMHYCKPTNFIMINNSARATHASHKLWMSRRVVLNVPEDDYERIVRDFVNQWENDQLV